MRVFDMVASERRHLADTLGRLTPDQLRQPSLCDGWTMHDIAAHLTTFLRFGQAKLYLGILATAADIDKINLRLTKRAALRPSHELIELLRRRYDSRTTIPRSGFDPVLADLVLHDLDVRLPLGIPRAAPEEPLWVTFNHLTANPALGFAMGSRLAGLRIETTDTGWRHGSGALVRGTAEAVVLGISGRATAFDQLSGDGVPILRERLSVRSKPGPGRRLAMALGVLVDPPPADRRSRRAAGYA